VAPAPTSVTVGIVAGIVPPPPIADDKVELIMISDELIIVSDELISVELMTDEILIIVSDVWFELLEFATIWYATPPTRIATMITAIIT